MDGKTTTLIDLNRSLENLNQSLDVTFNGVRSEFDDINDDIDIAFSDIKRLKKSTKQQVNINSALLTRVNWLTAAVGVSITFNLSIIIYLLCV